jgi:hypothetical protein
MTQLTELQKAESIIAARKAVLAERDRAKAIIAAGKRFGATNAEMDEAIHGDVPATKFARHHEIEALARQIVEAPSSGRS